MVDDMVRDGIDVKTAAEITGHSVVTMLRKYRQVTAADKRAAVQRGYREHHHNGSCHGHRHPFSWHPSPQ